MFPKRIISFCFISFHKETSKTTPESKRHSPTIIYKASPYANYNRTQKQIQYNKVYRSHLKQKTLRKFLFHPPDTFASMSPKKDFSDLHRQIAHSIAGHFRHLPSPNKEFAQLKQAIYPA